MKKTEHNVPHILDQAKVERKHASTIPVSFKHIKASLCHVPFSVCCNVIDVRRLWRVNLIIAN